VNCFVWQTCSGIKGLSPLHILPTFDIISGVAIDYMHCLLEGIGKRLFAIWLTPSAHPYSIGKHIQLLDKRLLSIKPPDIISRVPQAISNRKNYQKFEELYGKLASSCSFFLVLYVIVLL